MRTNERHASTGWPVVLSCSLLHAVSKVTRGRRYAFVPFIYDDEAVKIRKVNSLFLGEDVGDPRDGGSRKPAVWALACGPTRVGMAGSRRGLWSKWRERG
jgi:hypothetical protein